MENNENRKTKRRLLSYSDVLNDGVRCECDVCTSEDKRLTTKQEYDERTKIICNTSEYTTIDRAKEMNNYKVSDFSLSNLMAIGAPLNEMSSIPGDRFRAIANMESQMSSIQRDINNNKNNN